MSLGLLDSATTLGIQPMHISPPQNMVMNKPTIKFSFLLSFWLDSHLAYFNTKWLFFWGGTNLLEKLKADHLRHSIGGQFFYKSNKKGRKRHQTYQWVLSPQTLSLQAWAWWNCLLKFLDQNEAVVDMHQFSVCVLWRNSILKFFTYICRV